MSDTRPELSKKNPYWIDRHRYYELKHFCMQYGRWKSLCNEIGTYQSPNFSEVKISKNNPDPVLNAVERRDEYAKNIELIENSAKLADEQLYGYLLIGVTENVSYFGLRCYHQMPACRDKYYGAYRRFFFILDASRK